MQTDRQNSVLLYESCSWLWLSMLLFLRMKVIRWYQRHWAAQGKVMSTYVSYRSGYLKLFQFHHEAIWRFVILALPPRHAPRLSNICSHILCSRHWVMCQSYTKGYGSCPRAGLGTQRWKQAVPCDYHWNDTKANKALVCLSKLPGWYVERFKVNSMTNARTKGNSVGDGVASCEKKREGQLSGGPRG